MKKIMAATINPCTETTGEYHLSEAREAEFGREWGGNIRAFILNAMAREYPGAIHNLPTGAVVLTAEDGRPVECYWAVEE